jgi:uncharacterized iron-regulated membrane protein
MRGRKHFSLFLFVVFLSGGVYLLYDSIHDASGSADASVLVGALLSVLAVAALAWAIRQHLLNKALRRHLRGRHS